MLFKDICFCDNKECKKRKKCGRALENYSDEEKKGRLFSMAIFNCEENNMFIKRR
mgnify:FL=1